MSALYNLTLLGKTVQINTWGCGLTAEQESWVANQFKTAFSMIDAQKAHLSPDVATAIAQVGEVIVPASDSMYLGATGHRSLTLSLPYIMSFSVQWLASLMAHEGQHYLNHNEFTGDEVWRDEQSACIAQLSLALLVGIPQHERQWLETWMSDKNSAQLMAHMGGYKGPPAK